MDGAHVDIFLMLVLYVMDLQVNFLYALEYALYINNHSRMPTFTSLKTKYYIIYAQTLNDVHNMT
jgi:hypothetical protein